MNGTPPVQLKLSEIGRAIRKTLATPVFQRLFLILRVLAGLGLLLLSLRQVQWQQLVRQIESIDILWLVLAALSVLVGLALKLLRWSSFIRNYRIPATNLRLFQAYFVGQSANILLPFRGGELVRLGYFADPPENLPAVASTILLEKYLDLLGLAVCAVLVSYQASRLYMLGLQGWLMAAAAILTVLVIAAVAFGPSLWKSIRGRGWLPARSISWIDRWVDASLWLRNPRRLGASLLLTALVWGVMWLTNWLLIKSLGMPLGGTAAGLVLIFVYIGLIPALMPGNLGPFYYFGSLALLPFGIANDQALAYAMLLHAIVTLPVLLGGGIALLVRPASGVAR